MSRPSQRLLVSACLLTFGVTGCSDSSTHPSSFGTISTIAGTGQYGYSGDGGLATAAQLNQPTCLALDASGNLYIGDPVTYTVRKVAAGTGVITLYAGRNGVNGNSGNGGPAAAATLYGPSGCALDGAGNLYLADIGNDVIRKIDAGTGVITTIAGNGYGTGIYGDGGFSGDGGPALQAEFSHPHDVLVDASGNVFISDMGNNRVREIDAARGTIRTIAGNGTYGYTSSGVATQSAIANPQQLALDNVGNLYIAEQGCSAVAKVNLATGMLTTVAGNGTISDTNGHTFLPSGDDGPATRAQLAGPGGIALDGAGNLFIADSGSDRIREVSAATGIIQTVAGSISGYAGDGGPASKAKLHNPEGLLFDPQGNLYVADSYNSVVRVLRH